MSLNLNMKVAYLGRSEKTPNNFPHHSIFWIGLAGYAWSQSLVVWRDQMLALIALKPHRASEFLARTKRSIPYTAIGLAVLSPSQVKLRKQEMENIENHLARSTDKCC
jgi:hypothetical protein